MKDIKTLYNAAKNSGKEDDISAYREAVQLYLENNPYGYISNLEYIITSDIGANTLKEFVETNGLPIACYETVQEVLEKAIHKCSISGKKDNIFKEASEWLSKYRKKYLNCFMMYEYYADQVDPAYVESYYTFNDKGIQGRKLAAGMINKFGESAIADALITSDFIGAESTAVLHDFCTGKYPEDSMMYEWLSVTANDLLICNYSESVLSTLHKRSLSSRVDGAKSERQKVFREAVITGNDEVVYEYSDSEIDDIKSLISFKEYLLTWGNEFSEGKISDIQKDIYALYEELGYAGEFEEADVDVANMTADNPVEEGAPWLVNTRDKKKGTSPTYINRNHDMSNYGEDDGPGEVVKSDKPDMSMDDYRRPSAGGDNSSINIDNADDEEDKDNGENSKSSDTNNGAVQNYYYYTYNNSLNKNNHSFNKNSENSTDRHDQHDDHSTHSSNRRSYNDYSTGKRSNSNDYNNPLELEDGEEKTESKMPWELSILSTNTLYTEGVVGAIFGTALLAPIVLAGVGSIYYMIDSKIAHNKFKKEIQSVLSEMIGKKVTDFTKYETKASAEFKEFLSENSDHIFKNFYKFDECKDIDGINLSPDAHFTSGSKEKNGNITSSSLILCSANIATGLMKKDDIHKISYKLNKLSPDINVCIAKDCGSKNIENDLPCDDNGGDWIYFIKSRICDGGPEDGPEDNSKYQEYINKQMDDIKKSGYVVVDILLTISAEKLINGNVSIKESVYTEAVGDADDMKPESDHPVKDILTDIDRATVKKQQQAKQKIQDIQNVSRAAMKPVNRTKEWVGNMIGRWKDADETNIKEKMADPHARNNLFSAIKKSITVGSLLKAGLLLNPVFLFLTVTRGMGKNKREFRIRNEMIGEIKTEISIIDEKIKDADSKGDNKAKYQLMRFKNELNKKLLRVGGGKRWAKLI